MDNRESVDIDIKFMKGGVFFIHPYYGSQETRVLKTCVGIFIVTHYDSDSIFQ